MRKFFKLQGNVSPRAGWRTLVAALLLVPGMALATVAGVFQFVNGGVQVQASSGVSKVARKGTPLSAGETVVTTASGTAQIRMADGATIVVQPSTELRVVDFRYDGVEDGRERVTYRLERGGIRSITGAIGSKNKDAYSIETPVAHMGVRGTDHEAYFIPAGSAGAQGAPAGAYSKVNVGLTFVRTAEGEVVVAPNQVGFVAAATERPALLPSIPAFFNRSIGPQAGAVVAPTASAPAAASSPATSEAPAVAQGAGTGGQASALQPVSIASGLSLNSSGEGSVGATASAAASANGNGGGNGITVPSTPGSTTGTAVAYTQQNGTNLSRTGLNLAITQNGATLANAGSDAAFGVNWGSWPGGLALVDGAATKGSTHFIQSTQLTSAAQLAAMPATVVSASYSLVGGPVPTNQNGVAGALNSLVVGVNFASMQVTNYAVSATVGAASWSVSGSGTVAQFTGASGIALTGTCTSCPAAPATVTANGTATGAFVGNAAQRLITSFSARAAAQSVSGVGYLSR